MFESLPQRRASRNDPHPELDDGEVRRIHYQAAQAGDVWAELTDADRADLGHLAGEFRAMLFGFPLGLFTYPAARLLGERYAREPYADEMAWLAKCADGAIFPRQMLLAQRAYVAAHAAPAACSSVVVWDEQAGCNRHMRSLDWAGARALGRATRRFDFVDAQDQRRFQAVGAVGMAGLLTAMKPGFSAAIHYAPWGAWGIGPGLDPLLLLRQLFEDEAIQSYAEARAAITQWRSSAPVFLVLCGLKRDEACVVELGLHGEAWVRDSVDGLLVQTNHFEPVRSPFAGRNIEMPDYPLQKVWLKRVTRRIDDWYCSDLLPNSTRRRGDLESRMRVAMQSGEPLDAAAREAFSIPPALNFETAHQTLMTPGQNSMRIWARRAQV
ncbi:hypothetical protein [Magnetofaba australis]|uniref:Peptidase C45 acyl-coenzyme A:6-aminopenicillanic acid acyl-transferase n=1 Tax=Magnetofaba australis IT-1 TaxID=1434232 RepID=A0A1Y2K1P4_9PROT|nr:hypothetical protein [Magnetofaba australis]OSM00112.1 hypothetical protein MAIT1_00538 [Magnetofaba australis IT-1]